MAGYEYSWDWHPTSPAETAKWLETENHWHRANIAKSEFADEKIIRAMASHSWNWGWNDKENLFLPYLLENPNLTPELLSWLDEETRKWDTKTQHAYWVKRYDINTRNINYAIIDSKQGPIRTFAPELLNSNLDLQESALAILEMADHFTEQMWHDLNIQGHIDLHYSNSDDGDTLLPSETFGANEELLNHFSPGYFVTWARKDEELDTGYALDRIQDEGHDHFEDEIFVDFLEEEPFSAVNLAYAIGAGLQHEDLEVADQEEFGGYLEDCYADDREMNEVKLVITSDTPWLGIRYSELSEQQQMNLALNFVNVLKHPYLGRKDGIAVHLMHCMAKHDQSADSVKAFLLLSAAS